MKNEKLNLMLNKVVEYNNVKKGTHFKAFLYGDSNGYYFKIIEIISGNFSFNEIVSVKKSDEKFITIAQKPKLMVVSKNSWHYKLLKYVLKDNAPTPKDMQNGCPYFWLLIFSVIVLPFVLLFKTIKWVILLIPRLIFFALEQLVNTWIAELDDETAYDIEYNYYSKTKMPITTKMFLDYSNKNFFNLFLEQKYSSISKDDPNYKQKLEEIKNKWDIWNEAQYEKEKFERQLKIEEEDKIRKKRDEYLRKRREAEAKWEARMKPIKDSFNNIGIWFTKTFTVERGRVNIIVKRTKQFVGLIITLVTLFLTFIAVNYMSLALMVAADWCISNWYVFATILLIGFFLAIYYLLYVLYVLITSWGQNVVNKYKKGKKIWYIEPFIYLVWYPIKYLAMSIAYGVVYIILIPIKFIFYTLLFNWFLKPIGLFIAKIVVNFVKSIVSSSGIFGEYFGASYSDYCPGIEWTDFDEK
jgi:hypothetical protein